MRHFVRDAYKHGQTCVVAFKRRMKGGLECSLGRRPVGGVSPLAGSNIRPYTAPFHFLSASEIITRPIANSREEYSMNASPRFALHSEPR